MAVPAKVPTTETNWEEIDIYIFSNGQQNTPPRKYHLRAADLNLWENTLASLARSQYGEHAIIQLYTLNNQLVRSPTELENGGYYVAVIPPDSFIDSGYEKYLTRASHSWEKRQARKSFDEPPGNILSSETSANTYNLTYTDPKKKRYAPSPQDTRASFLRKLNANQIRKDNGKTDSPGKGNLKKVHEVLRKKKGNKTKSAKLAAPIPSDWQQMIDPAVEAPLSVPTDPTQVDSQLDLDRENMDVVIIPNSLNKDELMKHSIPFVMTKETIQKSVDAVLQSPFNDKDINVPLTTKTVTIAYVNYAAFNSRSSSKTKLFYDDSPEYPRNVTGPDDATATTNIISIPYNGENIILKLDLQVQKGGQVAVNPQIPKNTHSLTNIELTEDDYDRGGHRKSVESLDACPQVCCPNDTRVVLERCECPHCVEANNINIMENNNNRTEKVDTRESKIYVVIVPIITNIEPNMKNNEGNGTNDKATQYSLEKIDTSDNENQEPEIGNNGTNTAPRRGSTRSTNSRRPPVATDSQESQVDNSTYPRRPSTSSTNKRKAPVTISLTVVTAEPKKMDPSQPNQSQYHTVKIPLDFDVEATPSSKGKRVSESKRVSISEFSNTSVAMPVLEGGSNANGTGNKSNSKESKSKKNSIVFAVTENIRDKENVWTNAMESRRRPSLSQSRRGSFHQTFDLEPTIVNSKGTLTPSNIMAIFDGDDDVEDGQKAVVVIPLSKDANVDCTQANSKTVSITITLSGGNHNIDIRQIDNNTTPACRQSQQICNQTKCLALPQSNKLCGSVLERQVLIENEEINFMPTSTTRDTRTERIKEIAVFPVAVETDPSERYTMSRRTSSCQQTCDESAQTEWCSLSLEVRQHEDGHYTFHLPSLQILKTYYNTCC